MKKWFINSGLVVVLILLNVLFIYPIFQGEFTRFPLSIESVFLADARFIAENFPNIAWYPFWYLGLPFSLVYQPIPIFLTALVSLLPYISVGQSYRILTGLFLILGTIGVYLWARHLAKNKLAAFSGAMAFSLAPSIAYIFLNDSWYGFGFIPLRLVNILVYGEGPHIWGLAFVPFAGLFFQKLIRKPEKKINWIGTVILIGVILLTSLTAFVGLLVFLFFIFWIEASLSGFKRKFLTGFVAFAFVAGLSFFWYNPQFVTAAFDYSLGEGGGIFSGVWSNPVFSFFTLLAFLGLLSFFYRALHIKLSKEAFRVVLPTSLLIFFLIVIFGWFTWDAAVFPLPFRTIPRLIPELELAFALLLAVIISISPKRLSYGLAALLIISALLVGWNQKEKFWYITADHKDFAKTSEFVIAKKLEELGAQRVYATGTHTFWLNVFTDISQLRGGKGGDFGGLNPWWAHLSYFINKGEQVQLTEKWLRSLGLEYMVVNYPDSPVSYHDFENLERFGEFEEVFDYQGDKVLRLPTEKTSLALALPGGWSETIEKLPPLGSGDVVANEEFLDGYFAAVEEEGRELQADYPFGSWSRMRIPGGQVGGHSEVLIRQTYYPGWSAKSNGKRLKIDADPIGFIRIENPGEGEIVLTFTPSLGVVLSWVVSLTMVGTFVVFVRKDWQEKLT